MWMRFFRKNEDVIGDVVDVRLERKLLACRYNRNVPSFCFGIYLHDSKTRVGSCDLRVGMNEELYYAGNIGYEIDEDFRGNKYAYYAGVLLLEVAKKQGMKEVLVTCSPENVASRKTIERMGGCFVECVDVPKSHWLVRRNEAVKEIYRIVLK